MAGVRIKSLKGGGSKTIAVKGFFVAIGHTPNTQAYVGQLDLVHRRHVGKRDKFLNSRKVYAGYRSVRMNRVAEVGARQVRALQLGATRTREACSYA